MKPFRSGILPYAKRVREIHDLAKYLSPPLMKGVSFDSASWDVCGKEFSKQDIHVATKDGLTSYIQNSLENNHEGYHSILHEEWFDLLSTNEVKYNRKGDAVQIKRLASSMVVPVSYDRYEYIMVPCKKKSRTDVQPICK